MLKSAAKVIAKNNARQACESGFVDVTKTRTGSSELMAQRESGMQRERACLTAKANSTTRYNGGFPHKTNTPESHESFPLLFVSPLNHNPPLLKGRIA